MMEDTHKCANCTFLDCHSTFMCNSQVDSFFLILDCKWFKLLNKNKNHPNKTPNGKSGSNVADLADRVEQE